MTEYRLYPRLSPERADPLRSALVRDDFPAAFNHDQFESAFEAADAFPATGGRRMSESELLELRSKCLSAVDDQGGAAPLTTSHRPSAVRVFSRVDWRVRQFQSVGLHHIGVAS